MADKSVGDLRREIRAWLEDHVDEMCSDLKELVTRESPSTDDTLKRDFVRWLLPWVNERVTGASAPLVKPTPDNGTTTVIEIGPAAERSQTVVALAHFDTVFDRGTIARRPALSADGRMTGPGVFDMKAGIVQLVWAIRAAQQVGVALPPLTIVFNGDEEIGSFGSRPVIESYCDSALAALVPEASRDGQLKTARKGTGSLNLTFTGIPGHPGLDPERGANAVRAAAECVTFLYSLEDQQAGTQVSVGVLRGGTRRNVIAGSAAMEVDIRVARAAEAQRFDEAVSAWAPSDPRVTVGIACDWSRPVMERRDGTVALFEAARVIAADIGVDLAETSVGGASDGNFAAALGIPVLDGLGAVGDGAHAVDEWVSIAEIPVRAALVTALLTDLANAESDVRRRLRAVTSQAPVA